MKKTLVLYHNDMMRKAMWLTERKWYLSDTPHNYDMMVATNELARELEGEDLQDLIEGIRLMCSAHGNAYA